MEKRLLENINELFNSYDLFSSSGRKRNEERMKQVIPDITESEITELEDYLKGFFNYCCDYGDKLAAKYKTPFLPHNDDGENDIKEYVLLCQKEYPQIDEEHIRGLFGTVCWLANR